MAAERKQVRRSVKFNITRVEGERALVKGVAYLSLDPVEGVPVPPSEIELRVDSYGTFMRRAELEHLAHTFLEYSRSVDSHHDHGVVGGLVESYITQEGDPTYPPHVWAVKSKVFDVDAIKQLDDGTLTGYSIDILCHVSQVKVSVEGQDKPLTLGEMTDCEPRFLSLVKRPATHQSFTDVQLREDAERVVIVRCEEPMENKNEDSTKTQEDKKDPVLVPEKQEQIERFTRSVLSPERNEALKNATREVTDWTSFATVWGAVKDRLAAWGGLDDAYNLLYQVICSIRYDDGTDAEKAVKASQACADFANAVGEVMGTLSGQTRSEKEPAQRIGKKISASNMNKLCAVLDAMGGSHKTLSEFIDEHKDEEESRAVDDSNKSQMSTAAKPSTPATPAEAKTENDLLAQLRAEFDKKLQDQAAEHKRQIEALQNKPKRSQSNGDPENPGESEKREEEDDEDEDGLFGKWFDKED